MNRLVKVGKNLTPTLRDELIALLREYKDIFAWTHEEMPEIDDSVAIHKLCNDPAVRPVKQ